MTIGITLRRNKNCQLKSKVCVSIYSCFQRFSNMGSV